MYNRIWFRKYSILIILLLLLGAFMVLILQRRSAKEEMPIGGQRDSNGCLIPAGYAFDIQVGACIRAFEMTSDIKRAAELAAKQVGRSYALTVVSFNSYEEAGSYDITLERGIDRVRITVYIKNWKIVSGPQSFQTVGQAVQNILAKKYNKPISVVKITISKEVEGFAAGSVLFGGGGPGEGGVWLAIWGDSWEVVWDGNGNVDCEKMRQEYGFPDTILRPNFCI